MEGGALTSRIGRNRGRAGGGPAPMSEDTSRPMGERPTHVDLSIPALPRMELTATQTAEAVGQFMHLPTEQIEEVKMALIEACINAIEHSDATDGRVQIDFQIASDALTVVITDRGRGFDVPTVQQQLDQRRQRGRRRGWGLRLMQEMMDAVEVHSDDRGTTITMVKRR